MVLYLRNVSPRETYGDWLLGWHGGDSFAKASQAIFSVVPVVRRLPLLCAEA